MSKFSMAKLVKDIKTSVTKHSPEILTGIGIAGMLTTTVLAVKATPKALSLIEQRKEEINKQNFNNEMNKGGDLRDHKEIERLPFKDTFKVTWKCYIPAAVTASASIACLIGASSVHIKRNAVLATAYKLSETALTEYKEKVIETIGEKKEEAIREKLHKDYVEKNPVSRNEVIITEKGNTLCLDALTRRYFRSDIDKINKAVNEINRRMNLDFYVSLNDLYSELGIPGTDIGDKMGWNSDMGLIEVDFSAQVADDGNPCLVMDFVKAPKYDFDKFL